MVNMNHYITSQNYNGSQNYVAQSLATQDHNGSCILNMGDLAVYRHGVVINGNRQQITYNVALPKLGQRVLLRQGGADAYLVVTKINSTGLPIDSIELTRGTDVFKAVIVNGEWKLSGIRIHHNLTFE